MKNALYESGPAKTSLKARFDGNENFLGNVSGIIKNTFFSPSLPANSIDTFSLMQAHTEKVSSNIRVGYY